MDEKIRPQVADVHPPDTVVPEKPGTTPCFCFRKFENGSGCALPSR